MGPDWNKGPPWEGGYRQRRSKEGQLGQIGIRPNARILQGISADGNHGRQLKKDTQGVNQKHRDKSTWPGLGWSKRHRREEHCGKEARPTHRRRRARSHQCPGDNSNPC